MAKKWDYQTAICFTDRYALARGERVYHFTADKSTLSHRTVS
jgi:hypothetical protein